MRRNDPGRFSEGIPSRLPWLASAAVAVALIAAPSVAVAGPAQQPAKKPAAEGAGQPTAAGQAPTKEGAAPTPAKPQKPKTAGGAAPAEAEPAAPAKVGRESEIYGDRLDGLQREVNDLKDKIFRTKARLSMLRETVLRGVLAGSRVILAHRNLMGTGFRLVKIIYYMDGAQIFARADETGALDSEDELVIYDGNLPPGPHTVTVELTYKGHGYGVFSYLGGYTFESRSTHTFTAPESAAVKVASSGFERGNVTTEMKDRPALDFREIPLDPSGKPLPTRGGKGKKK